MPANPIPWPAESEGDGKSVAIERLGTKQEHIRPSSAKGALKGTMLYSKEKTCKMACGRHAFTILIPFGFVTDSIRQSVHERVGKCRS